MQDLRGWSALETGLAIFPGGLMVAFLAPVLVPRLVGRFGVQPVILVGMIAAVAAYLWFLPIGIDSPYLTAMLPTFILAGLAFALAYGPSNIAATNGIEPHEQGLAGGLVNTSFQFGGALGLAIVTAVNNAYVGDGGSDEALLQGYEAALVVPVIAAVIGVAVVALGVLPMRLPFRRGQPEMAMPRPIMGGANGGGPDGARSPMPAGRQGAPCPSEH